jgi:alkanesulfonate monooxygenase SsuD/methylene tetrahydromethanopterin reductase-like flavin-dependent oxidoreductase (luciferase family)
MPPFPVEGSSGQEFVAHVSVALERIEDRFDSVWIDDHLLPWASFASPAIPNLECLTTLAFLAAAHPGLDFGSSVLCQSFRQPALVARMGATLQLLTGGRFILGIGAGWMEREYRAYGYEFPSAATRVAQLEEAVRVIRALWTESPASFAGQFYRIDDAYCEPRPHPAPPILIGGGGERLTLRVVARHADWWNLTGGSVENYARKLAVLRRHCEEEGRAYDEIVKTWAAEVVAVAEDEREARRVAAAAPYRDEQPIVGTPEQVTEQLKRFADLDVDYLILRFVDFPSTAGAELFAEAVMPNLR